MKLVLMFPTNRPQTRIVLIPMVRVKAIRHPKDIDIHSPRTILRKATDNTPSATFMTIIFS